MAFFVAYMIGLVLGAAAGASCTLVWVISELDKQKIKVKSNDKSN